MTTEQQVLRETIKTKIAAFEKKLEDIDNEIEELEEERDEYLDKIRMLNGILNDAEAKTAPQSS